MNIKKQIADLKIDKRKKAQIIIFANAVLKKLETWKMGAKK